MSLLADSIDFFGDAANYALSLAVLADTALALQLPLQEAAKPLRRQCGQQTAGIAEMVCRGCVADAGDGPLRAEMFFQVFDVNHAFFSSVPCE